MACASVPLSTYSSSPPTGTPRARRLTLSLRAAEQLADVVRRGLAFVGEVGRQHDLAHRAVQRSFEQAIEANLLRADAVERRQPAHQHEIESRVGLGVLDHHQIGGRFDHAQQGRVALARPAKRRTALPR